MLNHSNKTHIGSILFEDMIKQLSIKGKSSCFNELSLVTLLPDNSALDTKGMDKNLPDLASVILILIIERNADGQIYLQHSLHNSGHLTLPTKLLLFILANYTILSQSKSEDGKHSAPEIRYIFIPSTCNYRSYDEKLFVLNNDNFKKDMQNMGIDIAINNSPLKSCASMVEGLFHAGIYKYFDYSNKKRAGTSLDNSKKRSLDDSSELPANKVLNNGNSRIKRKVSVTKENSLKFLSIDPKALPLISMGYSQCDTNEYSTSMSSIAGSIKPHMKNGKMSLHLSRLVVQLVESLQACLPRSNLFEIEQISNLHGERSAREDLISSLKQYFGGDENIENFRVEGITILIPSSIGYHKDTLNCDVPGMNGVLSMNARIPINEATLPRTNASLKFRSWLEINGFTKWFPCSVILYSRAVCGAYSKKMVLGNQMSSECILRRTMIWALQKRVGDVVDYRTTVWNNEDFVATFAANAKYNRKSQFGGKMITLTCAYDRLVSINLYSFTNLYFYVLLIKTFIPYIYI